MIDSLLAGLFSLILNIVSWWGYLGILFLMALESANIPVPSEVILPFAGFLVSTGRFDFASVVVAGALGNLLGSLINYAVAYRYREKAASLLVRTHLVTDEELSRVTDWFRRRGLAAAFLGRFLPVVRTFISFPAGMFGVNLCKFSILTFIGSFIWSATLVYVGYIAGSNWTILEPYFRQFDYIIVLAIAAVALFEVKRRFGRRRKNIS
jgi:membrane protein DedA with SNARE-associated domain